LYLQSYKLVGERCQTIEFTLCVSPLNDYVFPFHVTKLVKASPERLVTGRKCGMEIIREKSNPRDFRRLLRFSANAKPKQQCAKNEIQG